MKIVLITQNDPFYLPEILPQLFQKIKGKHEVSHCVLLDPSPFGKKESFTAKALKTRRIFGWSFFAYYTYKFIKNKLKYRNFFESLLRDHRVTLTKLNASINNDESLNRIREMKPDVLVSILGNEIFKKPLLEIAPCLNLHTALLPKYRGLLPTFWVLRYGESKTGVSVFLVDEGIDSGPIVVQREMEIGDKTQEELIRETKFLGIEAVSEALDILASKDMTFLRNDSSEATYFNFPTAADVKAFRKIGKKFF